MIACYKINICVYIFTVNILYTRVNINFRCCAIRIKNTICAYMRIFNVKSGLKLISMINLVVELVLYVKSQLSSAAVMLIKFAMVTQLQVGSSWHCSV